MLSSMAHSGTLASLHILLLKRWVMVQLQRYTGRIIGDINSIMSSTLAFAD